MPEDDRAAQNREQNRDDHRLFDYQLQELKRSFQSMEKMLREALEKLDRKLDDRLSGRDARLDDHDDKHAEQDNRLTRVETELGLVKAALLLVATLAAGTLWQQLVGG